MIESSTPSRQLAGVTSDSVSGRMAAIDIGSNSIRLVVAVPRHHDQFEIVDEERCCTRLARSLTTTGRLESESMDQTIAALQQFSALASSLRVSRLETIATCALREASNAPEFLRRIESETGLNVRVISAAEEGRYALRSVQAAFDLSDQNVAVMDVGGGSTEILLVSSGLIEKNLSTNLGAVRMTERYGGDTPLSDSGFREFIHQISHEVKDQITKRPFIPQLIYGTGGTFTTIADILVNKNQNSGTGIWGYRITRAEIRHLLESLRRMSVKERKSVPGLGADRADIIVAGLAIADCTMARLRANVLRVHTGGVRDGLLLSLLDERVTFGRRLDDVRDSAIRNFVARCGVETAHASHVAELAGRIFDETARTVAMPAVDRRLLTIAARLQDVGYMISYKSHHKHSYQLILNSRMPGFRKQELGLIATIARYHRGASPKTKHPEFGNLSGPDRRRVRRLTGILRLAGGLDRAKLKRIKDLRMEFSPDGVTMYIRSDESPELEIWAANNRRALFERAFATQLTVIGEDKPDRSIRSGVAAME